MLLDVKNLAITYGDLEPVVKDVSFTLDEGEVLVIVGESGSGKTTVIRTIQGCLPLNAKVMEGSVVFDGQELTTLSEEAFRQLRGSEICMIFQDTGSMLDPIKTIGSQFVEYLQLHGIFTKKEAFAKAVSLCNCAAIENAEELLTHYPFELSGGQRQRFGIAMSMAFNPKILLADEPTAALDVTTQAQVVDELMRAQEKNNMAIIMVTHNIALAAHIADKILVMKQGVVVEAGTPKEIIYNPQHEYTKTLIKAVPEIGGPRYVD